MGAASRRAVSGNTETIHLDDRWLLHSLALNKQLPGRFRIQLAAHRDDGVPAALVIQAATAPRPMLE